MGLGRKLYRHMYQYGPEGERQLSAFRELRGSVWLECRERGRGEEKRLEREIGALLRIFFLYSKSIGAIESFGAKYVCVHMWREIWPIWYLQEIFLTGVLRMGWRVQEWLWETRSEEALHLSQWEIMLGKAGVVMAEMRDEGGWDI